MISLPFRSQDPERGKKEMGMGRRGTSKLSMVSIVSRIWAERSHGLLYTEGADGERNGEWEGKARCVFPVLVFVLVLVRVLGGSTAEVKIINFHQKVDPGHTSRKSACSFVVS